MILVSRVFSECGVRIFCSGSFLLIIFSFITKILFTGTPMWKEQSHKSYRPVTVATFRSNFNYFIIQPIFTIMLIMVVK